jgi:SAM-dependent methyltransferase
MADDPVSIAPEARHAATLKPEKPMGLGEKARSVVSDHSGTVIVFFVSTGLSDIITSVVLTNTKISALDAHLLNLLVGALCSLVFYQIENRSHSLKALVRQYRDVRRDAEEAVIEGSAKISTALLSHRLAELYASIPEMLSAPAVRIHATGLEPSNRLEARASVIGEQIHRRITTNNYWYHVLNEFLEEEADSVLQGRFSLLLPTYLDIYLDLMRSFIQKAKAEKKQLHIWSFTNAIPSDWKEGDNSVSGNIMAGFAREKAKLIREMKEQGFVMRMVTMTSSQEYLQLYGFRTLDDTVHAWNTIGPEKRNEYLDTLHTDRSEAFVTSLDIPGVKFKDDLAEFMFFGLCDPDTDNDPVWEIAIAGGFSSSNRMLVARYYFFHGGGENPYLIDVPNVAKATPPGEFVPEKDLTIRFTDWPRFVMTHHGYGLIKTKRYTELMDFSVLWKLAADIWHTEQEAAELQAFLGRALDGKNRVLDAATGTGFHTRILQEIGKRVDALCLTEAEKNVVEASLHGINAIHIGDWRSLAGDIGEARFDAVVCLGSSIPYHSSWEHAVLDGVDPPRPVLTPEELAAALEGVIRNMRSVLVPGGKLILGLAQHTIMGVDGVMKRFSREVDGHEYTMTWDFEYDWVARRRLWRSVITRERDSSAWSFVIDGHLFDHHELTEICNPFFSEVRATDLGEGHYDRYIVCTA